MPYPLPDDTNQTLLRHALDGLLPLRDLARVLDRCERAR